MSGLPKRFATLDDYNTGPDAGSPTRIDPSSALNGFIRGTTAAAQHQNFLFGQIIDHLHYGAVFTFDEDFAGAIFDDSESRLDASFPWRTNQTGLVSINHNAGTAKNPGQLVVAVPGDGVGDQYFEFHMGLDTGTPLNFVMPNGGLNLEVVVKINEHADNLNEQIRFGLVSDAGALNGGDDALVIWRARAVDADHWMVLRRVGGVQTTTVLTAAPFTNDEYAVWRMQSLPAGDIAISFNGTVVQTVLLAGLPDPGVGCNLSCWSSTSVADTELLTVVWDRIRLISDPGDRSGPA